MALTFSTHSFLADPTTHGSVDQPRHPSAVEHEPSFRSMLHAATDELGPIDTYAEFGAFGGDRIAIVRASLPASAILGIDTFVPFDKPTDTDAYQSNLNCPLALTVRNLERRGIYTNDPSERITLASLDRPNDWQQSVVQLVTVDRSFSDDVGGILAPLTNVLADHAIIMYDSWNAVVSDAHHEWLEQNPDRSSATFCTFQTSGRAFVTRRRPTN